MKNSSAWNKGLTKETDSRVSAYAKKHLGYKCTKETREKLSIARRKHQWFSICKECGRPKGYNRSSLCVFCAAKFRIKNYPNGMTGRKLSEVHKFALLSGLERNKQTKPESIVSGILKFMFSPYEVFRYSGNSKFWIRLSSGKHRNPDFTNRFQNKVIEVFGRYWHKPEEETKIIREYKQVNWDCLVIWDDDININTRDKIMQFAFPYEYEEELKEREIK